MRWLLRHGALDFSAGPVVMGVLNVTPDSFSDAGAFIDPDDARHRAHEMIAEGAGVIDVGPESTRPGSAAVSADGQIRRIRPVIAAIRKDHPQVPISIDTRSAAVARLAVDLGADIINDVSGLQADAAMIALAVETDTPVIIMHMRGTPETMQAGLDDQAYGDVVGEIVNFLRERLDFAEAAGIPRDRLAIDPGIGFGKTVAHNVAILANLDKIVSLGSPVLVGASRKSFVGRILDKPDAADRVAGSVACAVAAVLAGAHMIRTHDVRATSGAVRVAAAIRKDQG